MGSVNDLMNGLFQNIERINANLQTYQALPNFTGGLDIRDRSGEVIASYQSGVGASGGVISDGSGDTVAHTYDNVMGGTTYDLGLGHTIKSQPNIAGGETFHDNLSGIVGYSEPAFGGGMKLHSTSGETLLAQNDAISDGIAISISTPPNLPDFEAFSQISLSSLEQINTAGGLVDVGASLDGAATLDIFELLGEIL